MRYRYALDVLTEAGHPLEHTVVTPDWTAAFEFVHFEGIRAGRLPAVTRTGPGTVEPVWDARRGEPYVAGFRVTVTAGDGSSAAREIPKAYVRSIVQDVSAGLVRRGVLAAGSAFRWVVTAAAAPADTAPPRADDDLFDVEEVARPLPLDEASLASFRADAVDADGDGEEDPHVPLFVARAVLDEAMDLARRAGDVETGGVLVGTLHRDVAPGDGRPPALFVEVTAQVPAPHTRAASTRLTFTGESWAAVRNAIALRRRGESMVGWWHSHPDWCRLRNCPPERRRVCSAADPFLSAEDVQLHAACFGSAHQVAMLASDSTAAGGFTTSMFGWWEGRVVPRRFHVLGRERAAQARGEEHATHTAP